MVRIKICGITSVVDALEAARLGADAIGLNFYAGSPRFVEEAKAAAIAAALPAFTEPVGLFVNESLEHIKSVMARLGLRTFQWHGDRPEPCILSLRMIPAFAVRDAASLEQIQRYLDRCRERTSLPAAILVDAHVASLHGGTGQVAPWDLMADFKPEVPLILAGGLTPDNVAEAIRRVRPYGVDVASGVESSPGKKDWDTMRRFIDQARGA